MRNTLFTLVILLAFGSAFAYNVDTDFNAETNSVAIYIEDLTLTKSQLGTEIKVPVKMKTTCYLNGWLAYFNFGGECQFNGVEKGDKITYLDASGNEKEANSMVSSTDVEDSESIKIMGWAEFIAAYDYDSDGNLTSVQQVKWVPSDEPYIVAYLSVQIPEDYEGGTWTIYEETASCGQDWRTPTYISIREETPITPSTTAIITIAAELSAEPTISGEYDGDGNYVVTVTGNGTVTVTIGDETKSGEGSASITIPVTNEEQTITVVATNEETGKTATTITKDVTIMARTPQPEITSWNNEKYVYVNVEGEGTIKVWVNNKQFNMSLPATFNRTDADYTIIVEATATSDNKYESEKAYKEIVVPALDNSDLDPQYQTGKWVVLIDANGNKVIKELPEPTDVGGYTTLVNIYYGEQDNEVIVTNDQLYVDFYYIIDGEMYYASKDEDTPADLNTDNNPLIAKDEKTYYQIEVGYAWTIGLKNYEDGAWYAYVTKGERLDVSLAWLEQNGEDNTEYSLRDTLLVVSVLENNGGVIVRDYATSFMANDIESGQIDYVKDVKLQTAEWQQNNWILLAASSYNSELADGDRITGVKGTYDKGAITLTLTEAVTAVDENNTYTLNNFVAPNFMGTQKSDINKVTYYFVNPKPWEVAEFHWMQWDGEQFVIPTGETDSQGNPINALNLSGSVAVDWSLMGGTAPNGIESDKAYNFQGIVKLTTTTTSESAPRRAAASGTSYTVLPINLDTSKPTTLRDLTILNREVTHIDYVNTIGQVSTTPWEGFNIVVTRYNDGTTSTTRVLH